MASCPENPGMTSDREKSEPQPLEISPQAEKQLGEFFSQLAIVLKSEHSQANRISTPVNLSTGAEFSPNSIQTTPDGTMRSQIVDSKKKEDKEEGEDKEEKLLQSITPKLNRWLNRLEPDRTEPETVAVLEGLLALLDNELPPDTSTQSGDNLAISQLRQMNAELNQKLTRLEEKLDDSKAQTLQQLNAILNLLNSIQTLRERGEDDKTRRRQGDKGNFAEELFVSPKGLSSLVLSEYYQSTSQDRKTKKPFFSLLGVSLLFMGLIGVSLVVYQYFIQSDRRCVIFQREQLEGNRD